MALIDHATGKVKRRYQARLDTVKQVSREIAKVYRSARSGDIPVADATKLAFILNTLGRMLEVSELEKRLDQLESTQTPDR